MDDIYFSDKPNQHKSQKKPNGSAPIQSDDLTQDAYSGDPVVREQPKFVVHMPEQEKPVVLPDRTPKGKPVASDPVQPRVPDYTPTQTSKFDDSAYLQGDYAVPQPSMRNRRPQPQPPKRRSSFMMESSY